MHRLLDITFTYYGKEYHVEVLGSQHKEGGYYVLVNKYMAGQIVLYNIGWTSFVSHEILSGDDVGVILDMIEQA